MSLHYMKSPAFYEDIMKTHRLQELFVRQKIGKRRDESGHAFCLRRIAAFAAQGIQSLVRNAITQNVPDINVYGGVLTRRAHIREYPV